MRASRDFLVGVLVVVLANILTTYAGPTAFYFFGAKNKNGVRMEFQGGLNENNCVLGNLPSNWIPYLPTCLVIHDYFENPTEKVASSILIKEALLNVGRPCNVVIVDWHLDDGFGNLNTTWHKRAENDVGLAKVNLRNVIKTFNNAFITVVPDVAYQVTVFIHWLRNRVHNMKDFHRRALEVTAFAHGMGAQVIGSAAQVLRKLPNELPIKTIIATDPTSRRTNGGKNPTTDYSNYMSKESAERVIIIKTNVGGFGSASIDGHIIFSINNEYSVIQKDAIDFKNFVPENAEDVKSYNADMVKSLDWVQVQPGFMEEKKGNEKLFHSHDLAPKFLAEQIMNPTTVTLETKKERREMTLFGEGIRDADIPHVGLLFVLSWKEDGPPKLVNNKDVALVNLADGVPRLSRVEELNCQPVKSSDLPQPKDASPAKIRVT